MKHDVSWSRALKSVVLAISDLHTFQSDTSRYHSADSVMPTPLHHNSFDLFLMCYSCYHLIWLRFVKYNAHCKTLPDRFVEEYSVLCKYWLLQSSYHCTYLWCNTVFLVTVEINVNVKIEIADWHLTVNGTKYLFMPNMSIYVSISKCKEKNDDEI